MGKTQSIGSFLKKKREAEKITIEEVAHKTKINLNILKHLEANELDKLPNKTYVKGFVKSVTKLLNIDQQEALEVLEKTYEPEKALVITQEEVAPSAPQVSSITPEQTNEDEINEIQDKLSAIGQSIFNKKIIMPIVVVAVIAIILKGIVSFFVQLSNEEKQITNIKETKPVEKVAQEPVDPSIKGKDENLFDMKATKNLQAVEEAKEKAVEEVKEEVKPEPVKVVEKKPEPAPEVKEEETEEKEQKPIQKISLNGKFPYKKFYPAPLKMYDSLANAEENKDENLLPAKIRKSIETGKENVFIHATSGDTWISYQSDDNEIKRFVLKQGRSVLIKGNVILLFMGNINVAHIFYNNQLLKTNSKTGVKSLIFPQSEAPNYELPLFPAYKGVPYKASEYKANMEDKQDA